MSESEEQTVTRDDEATDSEPEQSGASDNGGGSVLAEWWNRWCKSYKSDFDGSHAEQARGLVKYAVTWFLVLFSVGAVFGVTLHPLLTVLPLMLFKSFLARVSAIVSVFVFIWARATAAKLNELFG